LIQATYHYPAGFLWGSATSSYQVEGDNRNSDWWNWEQEADRILHGHLSGKACDWWGGLWKDDLDRAAHDHQNAHRLSIEWGRVEPHPAVWDEDAIQFYRDLLQGALARGLKPMVTLQHFTLPQWVAELGGWQSPEIAALFARYVRKIVQSLSAFADIWITINEPNVLLFEGYGSGRFPPGKHDFTTWPDVVHNMVLAHAIAYHAIHEIQAKAKVGVAHHYRGFRPKGSRNPLDAWACRFRDRIFNRLFPDAFTDGRVHLFPWRFRIPEAAQTQDFFGLNYYSTECFSFNPLDPGSLFQEGSYPEGARLSETGHIANAPEGLWEGLKWARDYALPIYITENGIDDRPDRVRPIYLVEHLHQVWRAANFNWAIQGYFYWTLVDNFEWERGWTQRFGLWELDPRTQERRRRPSADLYAEVCASNALSSGAVMKYAPESFDTLFKPRGPAELSVGRGGR
jgi:beta-glucosidase